MRDLLRDDEGPRQRPRLGPGAVVLAVLAILLVIVAFSFLGSLWENVNADTIMVIQAPFSGKLTWYATTWGLEWQGNGTITKYPKRGTLNVKMPVRFNDGGHGTLVGSVQYDMPLDDKNLTAIHTKYGSPEAVKTQLVETIVQKAVYLAGPLMSSKESYAEKRNDLIRYIEDQITNGVYQTRQREVKVTDQLSGQDKSVMVAEIVMGPDGLPARQEVSILGAYGVKAYNFTIKELPYEDVVEKQIQDQQKIAMGIQQAIAESRAAEQRKLTIEQNGLADVAKAKYEQEVTKQKAVTAAEQELAVARLRNQQMDQYKESELKRADADATYRRRIMEADGALALKLDTYLKAQTVWATAMQHYPGQLVPAVVMGGAGQSGNAMMNMMDILGVKAARDLALDFMPRPAASHNQTGGQ